MNTIEKALRMAVEGHATQKRKGDDTPYIIHPVMVALTLARHGFGEDVLAAALAHDLIEDTSYTEEDLRRELGDAVTDIVVAVTNDDTLAWKDKKLAYIESVRRGSAEVKAVATADKIHNAQSLITLHETQGAEVWKHFNTGREEKLWFESAMLAMLQETWQHPLVDEYAALVTQLESLA